MKTTNIRLTTAGPVLIALILLIAFGVLGLILAQVGEDNLRVAIKETSRPITTISANLLFNPLYTINVAQINDILGQYVDGEIIVYAATHDIDGNIVAQVGTTQVADNETSRMLALEATSKNAQVDEELEQYLLIVTPIAVGDEVIGSVHFVFDQSVARTATGVAQANIAIFTAIILVTTSFLFFFLIRLATVPLSNLAQAAEKIGRGDLSAPIQVRGAREIATLANALEAMRVSLQNSYTQLEQRVKERTAELETRSQELADQSENLQLQSKDLERANEYNQRRAAQFEAITEISNSIANVQKLDELLPAITKVVSEKLNYYHTGIFLLDEALEYAILAASNSEGGQRMLKRGHRLAIGKVGLVGNVAQTGRARIALDTGEDATYFNNPDLPETHSEIAIPLKAKNEVIGILDVQSTEKDAFGQDDIVILSTLADQISIAIENARLFETTQKSLAEAEAVYRQFIQKEWAGFSQTRKVSGYQYNLTGTTPVDAVDEQTVNQIASQGIAIETNESGSSLAIPIMLRGEVIGILDVQSSGEKKWSQDEIDIAQAIAERVAISAENARLFEQTSERAERERAVSMITTKIRSTNDPNEMLAIAVNEIKAALNAKDIRIQKSAQQAANDSAQ